MLHHHGRTEAEDMSVGQIFYPCMQCADIFFIKTDICQLGNCHLRVNMLAWEYCDQIKQKLKPIILSHRILPTLFVTYFAFLNQLIQFAIIQFWMSSELGDIVSKKLCSGYLRSKMGVVLALNCQRYASWSISWSRKNVEKRPKFRYLHGGWRGKDSFGLTRLWIFKTVGRWAGMEFMSCTWEMPHLSVSSLQILTRC